MILSGDENLFRRLIHLHHLHVIDDLENTHENEGRQDQNNRHRHQKFRHREAAFPAVSREYRSVLFFVLVLTHFPQLLSSEYRPYFVRSRGGPSRFRRLRSGGRAPVRRRAAGTAAAEVERFPVRNGRRPVPGLARFREPEGVRAVNVMLMFLRTFVPSA